MQSAIKILIFFISLGSGYLEASSAAETAQKQHSLCYEFQVMRNTVPVSQLNAIFDRHFRYDGSFKSSVSFLYSAKFVDAARRIEKSTSYQWMLGQFERVGVNVTDIATIGRIFECLILPVPEANLVVGYSNNDPQYNQGDRGDYTGDDSGFDNGLEYGGDYADYEDDLGDDDSDLEMEWSQFAQSRTLQSFATDVLRSIPRDRFRTVLGQELKYNDEFRNFYKILRNSGFQMQIMRSLNTRSMMRITRILRKNGVDLRKLMKVVFKIFSFGPVLPTKED